MEVLEVVESAGTLAEQDTLDGHKPQCRIGRTDS